MNLKHHGFQNLLYRKFISPGEHNVKTICSAMKVSLSTFYNYIEGVSPCPPDLIPKLYNATHDHDFLNFILNDTDQMLTPRQDNEPEKSVLEKALDVAAAFGNVLKETHVVIKDKAIDNTTRLKITQTIDKTLVELEALRVKINDQKRT